MPQQAARWTAEMVRALPDDGNRYEVVDRELLVRRAPAELHQRAVTQLALELGLHARQQGGFEVLVSPAGAGSPEYWIVDLDARVIEGWRPENRRPEILGETITWQPDLAGRPLTIAPGPLFARIHGKAVERLADGA